jgi:uncharacterized protein (TIGR03083 family)
MIGKTRRRTLLLRTSGACDLDPEHLLEVFADQRQRFVAVLRGFGPDDWAAPTRCAAWSAHDVVRHLCDSTPAIAPDRDNYMFDVAVGFDPRTTPGAWLTASADESPAATLGRLAARTEELFALARDRLERGQRFDVRLPYGPMDWTVLTLHIFWDSWIHERDVLLAQGAEHPTSGDATGYATAYGLFLAAAVARMLGEKVRRKLTFGGDGGGRFDLDIRRRAVTLTFTRATVAGRNAAQVADVLAGRAETAAVLGDFPDATVAALMRLADFFNTPSRRGGGR